MKIADYSYYKKNSLAKHNISQELNKHRDANKVDRFKRLNDFVAPVLSAIVAISIATHTVSYSMEAIVETMMIIGLFIASYLFITQIYIRLQAKVVDWINRNIRRVSFENDDVSTLVDLFNHDVVNQTFLSYCIICDNAKGDDILKQQFLSESFFHLEGSVNMLTEVFNTNTINRLFRKSSYQIHPYRVKTEFLILGKTYKLVRQNDTKKELKNVLNSIARKHNIVVNLLNQEEQYFDLSELLLEA